MSKFPKSKDFSQILLNTIFSFMVCDGDISPDEIVFIKKMASDKSVFGDIDINHELDEMVRLVNLRGVDYLEDFFKRVRNASLSENQELILLDSAIQTIQSDNEIKLDEINFLRILRTMLKVTDAQIIEHIPNVSKEFLSKDDLTDIYIKEIYANYFHQRELPKFEIDDVMDITESVDFGNSSDEE